MKTITKFIFSIALLWGLTLSSANAQLLNSGAECKAANLSQALALGMGHSQFGVRNNGAAPFFTVCPLDSVVGVTATSALIVGKVTNPGETILCTVFFKAIGFNTDVFSTTNFLLASPGPMFPNQVLDGGPLTIPIDAIVAPNANIVCALGPGQAIDSYGIG